MKDKILKKNFIKLFPIVFFLISCVESFKNDDEVFERNSIVPEVFPVTNKKPVLIAHAGGMYNGLKYTNSKEALTNAIKNNYNAVELDLLVLSDGKIGGGHDVEFLNFITGFGKVLAPISSQELKTRKIYDSLHPLLAEDIVNILRSTDLFLVTDKIDDDELLNAQIPLDKKKMLIETFSYESYLKFLRAGYVYPMLCIWNEGELDRHWSLFVTKKVRIITIPAEMIIPYQRKLQLLFKKGVAIFAFTSNDKNFILKYGGNTVTGFYTDFVTNEDLY